LKTNTPRADYLLIAVASLALCVVYFYMLTQPCIRAEMVCVGSFDVAQLDAPYRYRVLPMLLQTVIAPNATPLVNVLVDTGVHGVGVALLLPALYAWFKRWLPRAQAVNGVLLFAVLMLVMFNNYVQFGSSIIEIVLITYALLVVDRSLVAYAVLLVLAALTRETSVVLVAVYAAWHGRDGWKATGGLFLLWAAITAGVHVHMGAAPHVLGWRGTWEYNVKTLFDAILLNLPLLPLAVLAFQRYKSSRVLFKRFTWLSLLYIGAAVVGAAWSETRVLLPIFPLLIPMILQEKTVTN
jgi:hypothetical protein